MQIGEKGASTQIIRERGRDRKKGGDIIRETIGQTES